MDVKMSDHDRWFITTDGSFSLGGTLTGLHYHQKLNLLFITSKSNGILVYDITSSTPLKSTNAAATVREKISCTYIGEKDVMVFSDSSSLSLRKDLNGMYFLDTALQGKMTEPANDVIKLELTLADAETLVSEVSQNFLKVDRMDDVFTDLRQAIGEAHKLCQDNQKKAKWCTVTIEYPQSVILNVFQHIMVQLKAKADASLALPIAAAITERSGYYATDFNIDNPVPLDRALMYSEAARLATFENWPHKDYQWAKPESMSRAGFYHDPTSTNDDRSMCFTCNVCLVSWETTDEPWSEHERHQPCCPFIKGLPTQNVPLGVYYASQPALSCAHKLLSTCVREEDVYLAALNPCEQRVSIFKVNNRLDLYSDLLISHRDEECLGSPMSEASPPESTKATVTAMTLISGDRNSSLSLVVAALIDQKIKLSCYETGRSFSPYSFQLGLSKDVMENLNSEEPVIQAMLSQNKYFVSEPTGDKKEKGVVVPIKPQRLMDIDIPDEFQHPGYSIQIMEQSLDKKLLLVYIAYTSTNQSCPSGYAGALITYKISFKFGITMVTAPDSIKFIKSPEDCIVHLNQLNQEFSSSREIEGVDQDTYHMMVTKASGAISLMTMQPLKEVTTFSSSSHRFLMSEYCSGIDRVCATTTNSELVLLQVGPEVSNFIDSVEDVVDHPSATSYHRYQADIEALFEAPLSIKDIKTLSELTECDNLTGKFTATLASCWNEVNQDQLQRKHPQHLQRSAFLGSSSAADGDASHVTRTWKLQPDNDTATREHVVELSLPKITSVGHVDLRFTIQGKARSIPDIRVALLCHKVDARYRGKSSFLSSSTPDEVFLSQSFLDQHKLQLLSAPVSLASVVDVSGLSGTVTLTAPALLQIKPRSLVIYMKMVRSTTQSEVQPNENSPQNLESMLFPQVRAAVSSEKSNMTSSSTMGRMSTPRSSNASVKSSDHTAKSSIGMDLIDEISISVKKTKATHYPHEKLTRLAMLDSNKLHANLTEVAHTGRLTHSPDSPLESSLLATEQNRISAMRVLGWIAMLQTNEVSPRKYENSMLAAVEQQLPALVEHCVIRGTRSSSHTFTRLLTVCTELSRRLGETQLRRFSNHLLEALLSSLATLRESPSSGAVHHFFLLLSRVKCLDISTVCQKLCEEVKALSELYHQSFDSPDMHRLSSYGLTSSPYDAEVFEASLPPFVSKYLFRPSNPTSTFSWQDRQELNVKDEALPIVDLTRTSCQGFTNAEQLDMRVAGLLEVEPLQFSINSYSEYIHVTHGSSPSVTPVFYGSGSSNAPDPASLTAGLPINVPQTVGSIKAQLGAMMESMNNEITAAAAAGSDPLAAKKAKLEAMKTIENKYTTLLQSKLFKYKPYEMIPMSSLPLGITPLEGAGTASSSAASTSQFSATPATPIKTSGNSSKEGGGALGPAPYPSIQAILQPPNEFTLIAGRMSSGNARRYIVLDFGQPVRLTDVVIPACADITSLAIDVWLERELVDSQRLVVCTDISTKCLMLTDIQPACVCQYLKITYAPRTSGSGQTYRIPLGVFYGHSYVFPWETEAHVVALRTPEEVRRQICVYNSAVEDIRCCYKLACDRLRDLLQNAESRGVDLEEEDRELADRVQQTYQECIKLQQQLNLATNAIRRLRGVLPAACETDANQSHPVVPSRDKLRCLIEGLVALLLSNKNSGIPSELYQSIPADVCKQLFFNLCIHGSRKVQLLTGNLLVQVCSRQPWYGEFFERSLVEMYSSSNCYKFPKLRVFGLLVSMAHRSLSSSRKAAHRVCANVLQLLATQLAPLTDTTSFNGFVDMALVNWLLLFLSRLSDCNFDVSDPLVTSRWDFLSNESSISKRKEYHRLSARYKARQQRAQMEAKVKFKRVSSGDKLSRREKKANKHLQIRNKKELLKLERLAAADPWLSDARHSRMILGIKMEDLDDHRRPSMETDKGAIERSVVLDKTVVLPVVRGLMSLLLKPNLSCHTDVFILTCKVLARLSICTRPTLKLGEVATRDQLQQLIYNITHGKYNSRSKAWAGKWGKHAVGCLIAEIIEGERANLEVYDNEDDPEEEADEEATSSHSAADEPSGLRAETASFPSSSQSPGASQSTGMGASASTETSLELFGALQRGMDLMPEDLMDVDMNLDLLYETDFFYTENMSFMKEMLGPRPPASALKNSSAPPMVNAVVSPASSAIDNRLNYSCDGTSELRLQLWLTHELSNRQKALAYESVSAPTSSVLSDGFSREPPAFPTTQSRTTSIDSSLYTQNGNVAQTTEEFLGEVLSELICTEGENLDLESMLDLYLNLSEEFKDDAMKEWFDPSSRPYIILTPQAIECLVHSVANCAHMTTRAWTQLLRVLTILLNSNLNDDDRAFALRLCGSETFHQLLCRCLSSHSSVGPVCVKALEDMLSRMQIVHQAATDSAHSLADMLINTLTRTISESCARRTLVGALDAQNALLEFIGTLPVDRHSNSGVLPLFEHTINLTKSVIDSQDSVVPTGDDKSEVDVTSCFQPSRKSRRGDESDYPTAPTCNQLIVNLLKLLCKLLRNGAPTTPPASQQPQTDSSKLSRAGNSEDITAESMDTNDNGVRAQGPQTDEQKRTAEGEAAMPYGSTPQFKCMHVLEVDALPTLADSLLSKKPLISTLLQCLASCHLAHPGAIPSQNSVTIGDGLFQLLTILFQTSTNYYQMLVLLQKTLSSGRLVTLSAPLRLFLTLTLNCEHTIARFIELNGISCITSRLVESYSAYPDNTRGMVASALQQLTTTFSVRAAPPPALSLSSLIVQSSCTDETLMNFAPLGNIFSTIPSVSPMYSLIQASQTHRRARTAPWSHKFAPGQPWVDLNLLLPCAVLVKEIQIHPYLNSPQWAMPSLVSVELSRDGLPTLPCRRPIVTSGHSSIKIHLLNAEIVTMVTMRIHKPTDSATVGLTQICVLGYPGLSESGSQTQHTDASLSWLQVLYHCLSHVPGMAGAVIDAIPDKNQLLLTCCSLLISNRKSSVSTQLEKVIIELSLGSVEMSKMVIDILLRQNKRDLVLIDCDSMATDATSEILYRICLHRDAHSASRVSQMLKWLDDCATYAVSSPPLSAVDSGVIHPSKIHVQCVAAVISKASQLALLDVSTLLSPELFSHLFSWSLSLSKHMALRRAVHNVMAAICQVDLRYYRTVLQEFYASPVPAPDQSEILRASVTDDTKDDVQHEMLTDERKGDCKFKQDVVMNDHYLSVLASTTQSDLCAQLLIDSCLPRVLSQAVTEFCLREIQRPGLASPTSPRRQVNSVTVTRKSLPTILAFFQRCSSANPILKDWMGGPEGQIFWALLLELCTNGSKQCVEDPSLESSVVAFFKTVILNHTVNQLTFSEVMCNLLRVLASIPNSVAGSTSLSSFMKNLLLQTMLEDEKVYVAIKAQNVNYKFRSLTTNHLGMGVGVGHSTCTLLVSIHDTMAQIADVLSLQGKKKDPSALNRVVKKELPNSSSSFPSQYLDTVDPMDDMLCTMSSVAQASKDKRKTKAGSSDASQTDQGKMKGAIKKVKFVQPKLSDEALDGSVTVAEVILALTERDLRQGTELINLEIYNGPEESSTAAGDGVIHGYQLNLETSSTLKIFTGLGGLALLADHLPLLYPEITQHNKPSATNQQSENGSDLSDQDYEFVTQVKGITIGGVPQYETISTGAADKKESPKKIAAGPTTIPPHSLMAFGLFLRLPGYAEMLIKQRLHAKFILRLVLGVRDGGEGTPILSSPVASALPTLPFTNLKRLYQSSPLTTDDGLMLRRTSMDTGVLDLVLACLSALSHHSPRKSTEPGGPHSQLTQMATFMANQVIKNKKPPVAPPTSSTPLTNKSDEQSGQMYWAKGTGFGTGSTTTQWDLKQVLMRQKNEREHVMCLLDIISVMIHPDDSKEVLFDSQASLPAGLFDRISDSCLLPAVASYLRNDSVLDMSRHVPLYQSVYRVLRALASSSELVPLLTQTVSQSDSSSLAQLSSSMAKCVATYESRLGPSSAGSDKRGGSDRTKAEEKAAKEDEDQANSLNDLAVALSETQAMLTASIQKCKEKEIALSPTKASHAATSLDEAENLPPSYENVLGDLQFDTYKFLDSNSSAVKFLCPHHYETLVRQGSSTLGSSSRNRRLAQEAVTLSTSLPLSASSSVFVRCDEDRMDVMKVLITGPSDTPYMNGCFEFDVFFPIDYPTSPPLINLQTTGNHKVRFNPNLYNDGKVCLSVLNTWHGRPEEKWNAQTSSFLQVLVSIQSLILVNEPYFNEPGYERSRGTPAGTANCCEYDSNIRQATVKYAMLDMLKNPPPCFKEIIEKHFWLKRDEIKKQIESWLEEQEKPAVSPSSAQPSPQNLLKMKFKQTIANNTILLRKYYNQLMAEFQRMKAPEGVDDISTFSLSSSNAASTSNAVAMETEPTASTSSEIKSPDSFNMIDAMMASTDDLMGGGSSSGISNSLIPISDPQLSPGVYAANAAIDDWHTLPDISCFSSNSSDMMDVEDPLLAPQPGAFEGDGGEQDDSGGMFL